MLRGQELDRRIYEPDHIEAVTSEIRGAFPAAFSSFRQRPLAQDLQAAIQAFEREQPSYLRYMDLEALEEFEDNPSAFKSETKKKCPIILHCLMSTEEFMKSYKKSFNEITGRELLDAVRKIAEFGRRYMANFDDEAHERAQSYSDLGLGDLQEKQYGCPGVIGYGVQSSLLYGQYPHAFAHRSQNAVWSLYFLSNRQDFGLRHGSEFLIVQPDSGTCEQNFFYPADLFGYYALRVYLMLKEACGCEGITFHSRYRYIYLSLFCDHIADVNRQSIECLKWSSEHVESHWR